MITDRTIVSARAEHASSLGRRVVRGILTASRAAALSLPSLAAWGLDGPRNKPKSGDHRAAADSVSGIDGLVEVGCRCEHVKGRHFSFTDPGPIGSQVHARKTVTRRDQQSASSFILPGCDPRPITQIASP
jgi:hypothetical protein